MPAGMEQAKVKRKAEEKALALLELAKRARVAAAAPQATGGGLPADGGLYQALGYQVDPTQATPLDVAGVLRPLMAGGFRAMMVDGEWALRAETADILSGALLAPRELQMVTARVQWLPRGHMRKIQGYNV